MPPAARLTDMHVCPMVTVLVPHVGGPIVAPGCPTVLIGFLPAARVTDMAVCVGPPDMIAIGSTSVMIGFLPAARIGDMTVHGGAIVMGEFTVMIGGSDELKQKRETFACFLERRRPKRAEKNHITCCPIPPADYQSRIQTTWDSPRSLPRK